jgi:ABC-type Co2+ transport system permease subunit
MTAAQRQRRHSWKHLFHKHSLSIATTLVLASWIVLYTRSDPASHLGAFFGNAIADWSGLLVTVLATKYFYEIGSAESRKPPHRLLRPLTKLIEQHSLTIFLFVSGAGWIWLFAISDPMSKWGQVVGNIVSEWTQILGMVVLTKHLLETHSKESRR